ncbi:MAG: isochorismatase family protein [Terriglobia bacterium]
MSTDENSPLLLHRDTAVMLAVDLQYSLLSVMFEAERVVRNATLLLRSAEIMRVPRLLTTQYAKGLGNLHREIERAVDGVRVLDKSNFSCFGDPGFLPALEAIAPQADTLLIFGVESHICVAQTALGALEAGLRVHVAADAVSSRTPENWQVGLKRMERAGIIISSTEMMVYELLGRAGTPEFRAIHALVK